MKLIGKSILELTFKIISLNRIIVLRKINEGWKTYFGIKNNCKAIDFWFWEKWKVIFHTFAICILEFIISKLKVVHFRVILLEVGLPSSESMTIVFNGRT